MRDLSTYPISFPYGATTPPYSPTHPHSGEDRAAPLGTPIIISGTTIGLVGSTGQSTGNHCHIQKRINNQIVNPRTGGLDIQGIVEQVGENSEIGKYVRIRADNTELWSYFHMSQTLVKAGQIINKEQIMNRGDVFNMYRALLKRDPETEAWVFWTGKSWHDLFYTITKSEEYQKLNVVPLKLQSGMYKVD